jgi:hypothetical protein
MGSRRKYPLGCSNKKNIEPWRGIPNLPRLWRLKQQRHMYQPTPGYFHGAKSFVRKQIVVLLDKKKSRDSSVGIALCYGLDDRGPRVRFPAGAGNFTLRRRVQNGSGNHPPSYPMGSRGSFSGVKRPGREADHSPP